MESLLQRQQEIIEAIKKVERNFSKDSQSRKTRTYLDERLDSIDRLWGEFQVNNHKLSDFENDKEPYFIENQFQQARVYFDAVRNKIASFAPIIETFQLTPTRREEKSRIQSDSDQREASTSRGRPIPPTPITTLQGPVAELLSLQRTNFRAYLRQVNSLKVDEMRDKWELEDELRSIQTRWNAIDALHLKIDNILQGSDYNYDEEFLKYEKSFKEVKRALNLQLASTAHLQQATPHVDIPIFTGKYTQWPTFYDLFVETIHNNNSLTNAQKMQHLKGRLRGDAERLIQHLHISTENYETAWEIITHRYNNPQLLFTKQIEIFINQPVAHKQSAHEIRRLYDTTRECIFAIQNLGIDTSTWDPLLVHLIAKKLDSETYSNYKEARKSPRDLPSLSELMNFLEDKFNALEPISKKDKEIMAPFYKSDLHKTVNSKPFKHLQPRLGGHRFGKPQNREYQAAATCTTRCPLCNKGHLLYKCSKFYKLSSDDRLMTVIKLSVCNNCLYSHNDNICTSTKKCRVCEKGHNTMLHEAYANLNNVKQPNETAHSSVSPTAPITQKPQITSRQDNNRDLCVNHVAADNEEILLTTLSIKVKAADGTHVTMRALLDQGSQISLISENAAQILGLPRQRYHASVSGIGNGNKQGKGVVVLECQSVYEDYDFTTQALVINNVINNFLPNMTFSKQSWPHLQHIQLADPEYNVSRPIDLLLDASIYSDIIMSGLIKGPSMAPIAQQTRLGWILSGNVKTFKCHVVINDLSAISQYWELEEISESNSELTQDELYCEQLYKSTTKRLETGRYEVALPMNPGFEKKLGTSRAKAVAQFYNLEKKLHKNEEYATAYKDFMQSYEQQGYMVPAKQKGEPSCYLPHHGVLKHESTTTKLRTVFNASSKTSSGYSLNDLMKRGPNLQKDLQHLILVWRQHKYVITADIERMFCRIFLRESDQKLQKIVWRNSQEVPLTEYQLRTISFGTKAAPYLAMRTLRQLAMDDAHKFPLAAVTLMTSFYMDDLLAGCDKISEAKRLQQEIIEILAGAGMNIRKWSSNSDELTKDLSADQRDMPLHFKCSEDRKTLGLQWNPSSDSFSFQNKFEDDTGDAIITKRQLLSKISKIFDPLGWLSPITIRAKLLFQRTWTEETADWDKPLTENINKEWIRLRNDMQKINTFKIPRYLGGKDYIIHGFSDASEKGYSCVIYVVTKNPYGESTSTLVIAKTKLAPFKNKLTLPKLELCGALLLSRLIKKVKETFKQNTQVYAWTDSMVVLGWLHGDVNRWKQFVANRVRTILSIIPSSSWHHVRSEENAADCATRGLTSSQLAQHSLWWRGPSWLPTLDPNRIIKNKYEVPLIETKKIHVNAVVCYKNELFIKLLNECSSIRRITTTICWLSRFVQWLHNKKTTQLNHLTASEMQTSLNLIIKATQSIEFEDDLFYLKAHGKLKRESKLASLCAYIDPRDDLLKVGGRLNNSMLSQSAKHPIILPSNSKLTELVINQAHSVTLHGGPSLTLSYIREKYWIISGLRSVKRELRKCVTCRRYREEKRTQIMADLPEPRVTPSRPFTHTGVDFTGHFDIRANKGRGVRTHKGYVAVFVCLSTKAVHLELVSDLSTPGFLAAFRRFCARRGAPKHMYSDQGRNFIGASKLLKKEYAEIIQTLDVHALNSIGDYDIRWHFNAPANPSAGGLWEAAVKSFKYHLKRVIGEQKLTYEEFITILHQIEACLNSRPLIALSESPDDEYLSPGHFIIGGPLVSRPQTDPGHMSLTTRWQMMQDINKQFWKKWSIDYLQQLQVRTKWRTPTKNIEIDDIVLIKEENLPPGKWSMGRVVDVHPNKDGYVRVVSIKTKNGILMRPITKLSMLPVKDEYPQPPLRDANSSTTVNVITARRRRHDNEHKPRSKTRSPLGSFMYALIVILMFIITPGQCSYNISTLNGDQNTFFDKMYDMKLIRDEWKLIVYYNMTTYWSALRHVESYVTHLEQAIRSDPLPIQYKSIVYQLGHELSEIEHYNRILNSRPNKRQKRGLIDGVGYVARELFGVLDQRFAKKYEKDIEKISLNENHLQSLLKNQTSIIEAQSNILQRNEAIMNKQFGMVQKYLQNITLVTNRLRAETSNELTILSASLSAMIVISNIRKMQEYIIRTLTDITQGHINTHLLPPEQLDEQLNIIYRHIPEDLTLPADAQDYIELYKLIKISAAIGVSYLIIEVKIPLVNKEAFELDKVISLPQNSFTVEFSFPYIAYNLQKDLLLTLTETDVQSCVHIQTNTILCSINKPIYELQLTHSICNVSIHNKTMCSTKTTPCHERWIKLHRDNRWLFTCCGKCVVRIFCPDVGMVIKSLTGNGLLDIGPGCIIKSDTFSITGHNNYLSRAQVQGEIPILPEISILNSILNSSLYTPIFQQPNPEDHQETWRRMQNQINYIKEQEGVTLSVHDVHQYSVLYSILGLIIVTGAVCLVMRRRKSKRALEMRTPSSTEPPIQMAVIATSDGQATATYAVPRPRAVRLDIPATNIV